MPVVEFSFLTGYVLFLSFLIAKKILKDTPERRGVVVGLPR
jgi:predicted permease